MKIIKKMINRFFPNLRRDRIADWCLRRLSRKKKPVPYPGDATPVWVAGLFDSHAGIAAGARAQIRCFQAGDREVFALNLSNRMTVETDSIRNGPGIVVVHQNPPYFLAALRRFPPGFLAEKYIVAYWAWELEKLPDWWKPSLDYLHEIWVPSRFVADAVARATDKPVRIVPHAVNLHRSPRRSFAEDGRLRVLFIFDGGSSYARKNPSAAIEAFLTAFGDGDGAELLIKIARHDIYPPGWEALCRKAAGHAHIRLQTEILSDEQLMDLYQSCDIYLSLHRSEGFGLTIFDAMNLGLEVVATGWSGNMDFMTGPRCHAVNYTLISVSDPQRIYPYPDCRWAEPDVNHAAVLLRRIAESYGQQPRCDGKP